MKLITITLEPSRAYSLRQTAAIFKVKPLTITRWINDGKIAAFKEYRDWCIAGDEIERVINERRREQRAKKRAKKNAVKNVPTS